MTTTEQRNQNQAEHVAAAANVQEFQWSLEIEWGGTARSIMLNRWGGIDFHQADGSCLRACPIDEDWDAGFNAYALSKNTVLLAEMEYHGKATPALVAKTLNLLAEQQS